MKTTYLFFICGLLFFSTITNAQKRALGSSINVEFSNEENNSDSPDLIMGFFHQFPIRNKFALNTTLSFGKKRYFSRTKFLNNLNPQLSITQYHEATFSFVQMLKIYFGEDAYKKSKLYGAIGYSLRSAIVQKGEIKTTLMNSAKFINENDLPMQPKINLAFGVDYFLDNKFYLSMETGFQSPLWQSNNEKYPILVGSDMLYINLKVGIHLNQLIYLTNDGPEIINIKDLEIKN